MISIEEFKALWKWCDTAPHTTKGDIEFWRRFHVAISVYDHDTRKRLTQFANLMY